ncbi:MAG: hypothetical protein ABI700_23895 [Chloroflexota bacterium]
MEPLHTKLRTHLIGKAKTTERKGSYRHRPGMECGAQRKQVFSPEFECDFLHLCHLLTVDEQAFAAIQHLAAEMLNLEQNSEAEILEKKAVAIVKCRRKLDALRSLFEDGDVEREEYLRCKQTEHRTRTSALGELCDRSANYLRFGQTGDFRF